MYQKDHGTKRNTDSDAIYATNTTIIGSLSQTFFVILRIFVVWWKISGCSLINDISKVKMWYWECCNVIGAQIGVMGRVGFEPT
jgi:hypothetical protein